MAASMAGLNPAIRAAMTDGGCGRAHHTLPSRPVCPHEIKDRPARGPTLHVFTLFRHGRSALTKVGGPAAHQS